MRIGQSALVVLACSALACGKPKPEEGTSARTVLPSATSSAGGIATAERAAAARAPDEVCVPCSARLAVDGAPGATCRNNGPPSSHDLLIDWGKCLCRPAACASRCEICGSGTEPITLACLACGKSACATEYAACAADVGRGSGD